MIQEQETQTNDLNSDTLEEVSEQELHNITGGCNLLCGSMYTCANIYKQAAMNLGLRDIVTKLDRIAEEAKASRDGQWQCCYKTLRQELRDIYRKLHQTPGGTAYLPHPPDPSW